MDGEPLGRPLISITLALRGGGRRHLLLVGVSTPVLMRSRVTVALGSEVVAAIDPEWLQTPLADEAALVAGLSDAGRGRLVKLFLTTGASLFGADGAADFARAARRLLDLLNVPALTPTAWYPAASAGGFLTYRIEGDVLACCTGSLVYLAAGQVRRLAGCELASERSERGSLLHVHVPEALTPGSSLVVLGGFPVCLRAPTGDPAPRALVPWLSRRAPAIRAWVQSLVEPAAEGDPAVAALMREINCECDELQPTLEVKYLAATHEGVLHAFELRDPHDLVRAVRVERGDVAQDIVPDPARFAGRHLIGYTALPRRSRANDRFRLRLVYRSGRVRTRAEGPLARYRGEFPAGWVSKDAGAPEAVARARLSLERTPRPATTAAFGTPPDRPNLSVIVAVGDNLDVVRARAAMLFAEPGGRDVEVVYHDADGPLVAAARAAIADAAAVFGISHRLVILPEKSDATVRLLAAFDATRGAGILVLGADVLSAASGWLAPWLCRLVSARPILGGTLIDAAGAVLHAGVVPGDSQLRHIGLPSADLPDAPAAATMLVSAECVGLTRSAAELVRDSGARYPNPDVMLADTVARLRAEGREVATLLRCRFVRYADAPVDRFGEAVDSAALQLVLKRSFSPSRDERQA